MTNKIGDKPSPWKIPLFIFTSPSVSPPDVNSTFQFFIDFSITFFILSATSKRFWGTAESRYEEVCHRLCSTLSRQHSSHSSLAVFSLPFYLSSADLWFPSSAFCIPCFSVNTFFSSGNSFSISICPSTCSASIPMKNFYAIRRHKILISIKFYVSFPFFLSFNVKQGIPFVILSGVLPLPRHLFKSVIIIIISKVIYITQKIFEAYISYKIRAQFNNLWSVFHNSSWSIHEPYFMNHIERTEHRIMVL